VATSREAFAHESEALLAQIFDFYRIAWEYEPRSFPIEFDERGRSVAFFTPDFYLPDYDLYIELTVAKAEHNTRKNRKLRLLRRYHPGVRVKLLTKRDAERLFARLARAA
jgi:hypothetical protein